MTYVIAGSCIKDDSCIEVCPVDCIHPKPGSPDFESAEQLYIDPAVCARVANGAARGAAAGSAKLTCKRFWRAAVWSTGGRCTRRETIRLDGAIRMAPG